MNSRIPLLLLLLATAILIPSNVYAGECYGDGIAVTVDGHQYPACSPGQICSGRGGTAGTCLSTVSQACDFRHTPCNNGMRCSSATHYCVPDQSAPPTSPATTPSQTTGTTPQPTPAASAAEQPAQGSGGLTNPLKAGSITELLEIVLGAIVQLGSILLVLALVWVGFLFVAAQGAEEKIRDARNALMWTVIGGLILLGASAIGAVIKATVTAI